MCLRGRDARLSHPIQLSQRLTAEPILTSSNHRILGAQRRPRIDSPVASTDGPLTTPQRTEYSEVRIPSSGERHPPVWRRKDNPSTVSNSSHLRAWIRENKLGPMTHPLSINNALDKLVELDGMPVELEGVLAVEAEGYQLLHYPKAERRPDYTDGHRSYPPTVLLAFGTGSLQPNREALSRWLGKRVRVHGILRSTRLPRSYEKMDVFGLVTPASIEPYSIQRLTAEERRDTQA
jgi:hypothetical protein